MIAHRYYLNFKYILSHYHHIYNTVQKAKYLRAGKFVSFITLQS